MKLKYRFFLIFSALSLVPLLLFFYIAYTHYISLSNTQIVTTSLNIMDQAVKETNSVFSDIQHILETVQYAAPNEESFLQELRKFSDTDSENSAKDIYEANKSLKSTFQNMVFLSEYINGIFVFTPSGEIIGQGYGNGVEVRSDYNPKESEWYENTLSLEGKIYADGIKKREYLLNDTLSVSFSMCIYDVYSRKFLGVLYVNCAPEIFSLDKINVLPKSAEFTLKRADDVLYSTSDGDGAKENQVIEYERDISCNGVVLTAVFDKTELAAEYRMIWKLMVGELLIFLIIFVVLSYFLSQYLTKPITALSRIMAQQREKLIILESPYFNRTDEIGTLYNQYYNMLEENKRYIKSEYENKLILMDTQMKALESQINAHFLYNTLEAINSLAEIEGEKEISTMALALGDMFRYSIKTKGAVVILEKELCHVENFVAIQQIRFDNAFIFNMDVPQELLSSHILKLTLQPLVENALYHGLLNCSMGSTITLSARKAGGKLYFSVTDDGVGISGEAMEQLRKSLMKKSSFAEPNGDGNGSIGLKNINSRIQLYYGEQYGVNIVSETGKGTTVTICVPEIE